MKKIRENLLKVKDTLSTTSELVSVKWSDNTSFPISGSLSGTEYIVGLVGSNNGKWTTATILSYINSNAQITEPQVTNLASSLASKLDVAGGTMTGFLTLFADPVTNLQAATKQYVDNSISIAPYVLRAGDTMTGNLAINAQLSVGTSTNVAPLTVQVSGGNTYNLATSAYFGSVVGANANNYYQISIAKGNYEAILLGINQNAITGNIPANYAYLTTFSSAGGLALGVGNNSGLPLSAGILINSSGINIPNNLSIGTQIISSNAILQLNSTTQGFVPTIWTSIQESNNTAGFGSGDSGLQWYNSTTSTNNYWDGSVLQQVLTIQHLNPGSNITFDNSIPGQLTINATGGGTAPTAAFASWCIAGNPITTTVQTSFTTVGTPPDGSNFTDINSSDFNNQILMVGGLYTAISTYIGTSTQYFMVDANLGIMGSSGGSTYVTCIAILTASNTLISTAAQMSIAFPNLSQNLPEPLSGIVQLNPGDSVFIQIKSPGGASNCMVGYLNFKISNIAGSIPNTNSLSQGTNNIYLSQNGGTSYQNVNGTPVVGNLSQFNTTGGQLIDSGVPASAIFNWVTVSGTNQQMAMNTGYIITGSSTVTFTLPASTVSIGEMKVTGYGNANWIVQTNVGQTITDNGILATTSAESSTFYDAASFIYAGNNSGIFNIQYQNGMQITLN